MMVERSQMASHRTVHYRCSIELNLRVTISVRTVQWRCIFVFGDHPEKIIPHRRVLNNYCLKPDKKLIKHGALLQTDNNPIKRRYIMLFLTSIYFSIENHA